MLGLLVAIPFGCDDDGTSPPDPDVDELPDTIPSGTYEVGDLELPAGESFTVAGDVVVLSSGSVVLDGAVIIGEAGSLTIVAEDSVILNGYIGPDTTGAAAAALLAAAGMAPLPGSAPRASREPGDPVNVAGQMIGIYSGLTFGAGGLNVAGLGEGSQILVTGTPDFVKGTDAPDAQTPGGPGADIHIGDAVALAALAGEPGARAPALITIAQGAILLAGSGGDGFTDTEGTPEGTVLTGHTSAGGRGGNIGLSAGELVIDGEVRGGAGGWGGSCGAYPNIAALDPGAALYGEDATTEGQPGTSVTCTTGKGGDGGTVELAADPIAGAEQARGGPSGGRGWVFVRAGNGKGGGSGGVVDVRFEGPGSFGQPFRGGEPIEANIMILSGGNGGAAPSAAVAGGPGGSITLLDVAGANVPKAEFVFERSISSGGAGYSGCLAQPYGPGSAGGGAGGLFTDGGPLPEYLGSGDAHAGGAGSDGLDPGPGGMGGFDDSGNRLGPDGSAGVPCNPAATVVSVEAEEDILDEATPIELVILGLEFGEGCVVRVNGVPVEGECESDTEANATVPPAQQQHGDNEVCVDAAPPGGGSAGCGTVVLRNPAAAIDSLSRTGASTGAGDVVVRVYGDFKPGVTFTLDGEPIDTVASGPGWYDVRIPGAKLSVEGNHELGAVNPEPNAGVGTTVFEAYGAVVLGDPDITEIVRDSGEATVYVPIDGDYVSTDRVFVNGVETVWETFVPGVIAVTIREQHRLSTGTLDIVFDNGNESNAVSVEVVNEEPDVFDLGPHGTPVGSPDLLLTVYGDFWKDVQFTFDGVAVDTVSWGADFAIVRVPAALLMTARQVMVRAQYADGQGDELHFDVFTEVSLGDPVPSTLHAGAGSQDVILPITGFWRGTDSVFVNGVRTEWTPGPNLGEITVHLTAEQTANGGDLAIVFDNGLASEAVTVAVTNARPVISLLDPDETHVFHGDLLLTVHGEHFAPGAVVWFAGTRYENTTFVDANTLTLLVPAAVFEEPGLVPVFVENLYTDSASTVLPFLIYGPTTLGGLSQTDVGRGDSVDVTMNVGGFYTQRAVVLVNGDTVPTVHESPGVVRFTLTSAQTGAAGGLVITILDGEVPSANYNEIAVINKTPEIVALTPDGALVGAAPFVIEAEIENFYPGETVIRQGDEIIEYGVGENGRPQWEAAGSVFANAAILLYTATNPGTDFDSVFFHLVNGYPEVTSTDPVSAWLGFTGPLTINGSNFQPGATLQATLGDGTQLIRSLEYVTENQVVLQVDSPMTAAVGDVDMQVVNPTTAWPDYYPKPDALQSAIFQWFVEEMIDRCLEATGLTYGELFEGELDDDDCTIGSPPYHSHQDNFYFTPAQVASLIIFSSTSPAYARAEIAGALMDYVFSFDGMPESRTILAPAGRQYGLHVTSNSGSSPNLSYGVTAAAAPDAGLNQCFGETSARPIEGSPIMVEDMIDAMSCNRWIGRTILADEFMIARSAGETFRLTLTSNEIAMNAYVACSGPYCDSTLYVGRKTAPNQWMVEFSVSAEAANGGSVYKAWLASETGAYGAYSFALEVNPEPLPVDVCNTYEQNLPVAAYGTPVNFTLDEDDCPDLAGNFFELFEILIGAPETQLDLNVEVGEFMMFDREGNQVGVWSPTLRFAFYPPGEYLIQPITIAGIVPVTGTINIGAPESAEIMHCAVNSSIWPGGSATQTLRDELDDYSCSASGSGNERRLYDNYDMLVPPGRTVVFTQVSAEFDPVMYLSADNWSTSIVDDNSGGGTTARIVYTNSDSIARRVVIRPSTPFVDYGEPGNTGTYVFSAEWGP